MEGIFFFEIEIKKFNLDLSFNLLTPWNEEFLSDMRVNGNLEALVKKKKKSSSFNYPLRNPSECTDNENIHYVTQWEEM